MFPLPAIYVPFAAGNGEQTKNVAQLVKDGGGILIPDAELTAALLVQRVSELIQNPSKLQELSQAASGHGLRRVSELIQNPSKLQALSQAASGHGLRDADKKVAQSALTLANAHK